MRKVVITTFLTLDGVMQGPGGPEEDRSGGFEHGGWSVKYWDDRMDEVMGREFSKPFDMLLGRRTYEIFAAYWAHTDEPGAKELNDARKHVASRTLKRVEWQNSTLIKGDVADYIAQLKRQDGPEMQVPGSGNLIQTLLKHDLVDEFRLKIFPVVLGSGKRLFADGTIPAGLKLIDTTTTSKGVTVGTYERAGAIEYGTFAPEEPAEAAVERGAVNGR